MSINNSNTLGKVRLSDLPHQNADLVIEWLNNQPDFIGEAVAKMCCQLLSKAHK
ncbi:hypothetical protein [Photobacterium leiognathi]|uniref:hypothetical protein n=1 Tax=Photobacterium leiognathi TaxID=553611 RepID=UPI0029816AC2|nr:hypothetical protein [Photobacterium leiognathi]